MNSKPVRVMLLTQWFDPEPTFKGLAFARELVKQGFEVEVVTGFPNYPSGKIYPGYKIRWILRESIDGVYITRLPLYPSHDASVVRRVMNYVSFGVSSLIYSLFMAKRPDVIYAYHPPLTVGLTASMMRVLRKVPVVYDVQDMWPDTLRATGMLSNERVLKSISRFCSWIYRRVDRIVVLSNGFKSLLLERGVASEKVKVIYNWCDERALSSSNDESPRVLSEDGQFHVMFAGNMGKAQGLSVLLDVAEKILDLRPNIRFVFLGSGLMSECLKQAVRDRHLSNVVFMSQVPMAEVGSFLKAADVLMVHLCDDPLFKITVPSKTQAYMAIGKPILMAVRGDAADIIEEAGCGVIAIPEDVDSITAAVVKLESLSKSDREKLSEAGRSFYFNRLSLELGVKQFADLFHELAVGPSPLM